MGRRNKTNEQEQVINEEVINNEEQVAEEVAENPEQLEESVAAGDMLNPEEGEQAMADNAQAQEEQEDSNPEDNAEDEFSEDGINDGKPTFFEEETLLCKLSVLEHDFMKRVRDVAYFDVYAEGLELKLKNKSGKTVATFIRNSNDLDRALDTAMKLQIGRLFPMEMRAKGTYYTYVVESIA